MNTAETIDKLEAEHGTVEEVLAAIQAAALDLKHYRELSDEYTRRREDRARAAFRERAARGGFRHVGSSGRV